jgi:hypothetical protein
MNTIEGQGIVVIFLMVIGKSDGRHHRFNIT